MYYFMGILGLSMTISGIVVSLILMCTSTPIANIGMWSLIDTIPGILLMIFADGRN